MPELWNESQGKKILSELRVAETTFARMKGLLGTTGLSDEEALWIHACNSVHTFFMKYSIDCVFLDRQMNVKALVENVQPGKIVWPRWGATSVIEMKSGAIRKLGLKVGDRLNVGT
jgi:hypothetical protein